MKKKISAILFGLLFLVGFGILIYPTVSNQWNTYRQSQLISNYQSVVQDMTPEDFTQEWERAEAFNATITQNNLYSDVFGESTTDLQSTEYWKILNEAGDGIMGYLSIPKINIKLAIYHGTADDVLQTGVGHLNGTKLPIGGESTHCVVAAHRGLPSAKLFTDIDQLRNGDKFYIHVLDQVLAYEVDQILPMVRQNLGIGFIPEPLAQEVIEQGIVIQVPLLEEPPVREICFVEDKSSPHSMAANVLKEMLFQAGEKE